jgi:hypothetical protein
MEVSRVKVVIGLLPKCQWASTMLNGSVLCQSCYWTSIERSVGIHYGSVLCQSVIGQLRMERGHLCSAMVVQCGYGASKYVRM